LAVEPKELVLAPSAVHFYVDSILTGVREPNVNAGARPLDAFDRAAIEVNNEWQF